MNLAPNHLSELILSKDSEYYFVLPVFIRSGLYTERSLHGNIFQIKDTIRSCVHILLVLFSTFGTYLQVENKHFSKFPKLPHGYGPTSLAADLGIILKLVLDNFSQPKMRSYRYR